MAQGRNGAGRLAVTGATGKLGRLLWQAWDASGATGRIAARIARRDAAGMSLWTPGSGTTPPTADTLLCLWGVTGGTEAALADNVALVADSAELAARIGARRVLHCSSAAVYAGGGKRWDEEDAPAPTRPYGAAKARMEEAIAALPPGAAAHCALRLANVAGADQLFASLDRGGPVTLDRFADGQGPRRSYVAPSDLAALTLRLADLPPEALPPVLNVAGPRPVAMEAIVRAAGREVIWQDAPDAAVAVMEIGTDRLSALAGVMDRSADADALVADWRSWREVAA